jgi:hypothetical protein
LNKLHKVYISPNLWIRALEVPGGLLFITDTAPESGDTSASGVTSTFIPMTGGEIVAYLRKSAP